MIKVKLTLIRFGLFAMLLSQAYFKGREDFDREEKDQAFAEYVAFAKPFQQEVKRMKRHHTRTVWEVAGQ